MDPAKTKIVARRILAASKTALFDMVIPFQWLLPTEIGDHDCQIKIGKSGQFVR